MVIRDMGFTELTLELGSFRVWVQKQLKFHYIFCSGVQFSIEKLILNPTTLSLECSARNPPKHIEISMKAIDRRL